MKFKNMIYPFSRDQVSDVWVALNEANVICDGKQVEVKVKIASGAKNSREKPFAAKNKVNCALQRLEDILDHFENLELRPCFEERTAFNFLEFLNCEYLAVHCIMELAVIFNADYSCIKNSKQCFGYVAHRNGTDTDFFEYIRSLCAVHPLETGFHPNIHGYESFDCCPRIYWDNSDFYDDKRDLTVVVYPADSDELLTFGVTVESFIIYLNKWIRLLDSIANKIRMYIGKQEDDYRRITMKTPEDFFSYIDYIEYLKTEYAKRRDINNLWLFDKYKLAFIIEFQEQERQEKKECYKNAIIYMFSFLHKQLQKMDEQENTGINDLAGFETTNLFLELYNPLVLGSSFSSFHGIAKYIDHLNSSIQYEVRFAREIIEGIKPTVNKYIKFQNNESAEETDLIIQIARYLEALELDGHIKASIPYDAKYRGE